MIFNKQLFKFSNLPTSAQVQSSKDYERARGQISKYQPTQTYTLFEKKNLFLSLTMSSNLQE